MSVAKLSSREVLFVSHFVDHGDAYLAAQHAGYSPTLCEDAYRKIMGRPSVLHAIAKYRAEWDQLPDDYQYEAVNYSNPDFLSLEESDFILAYLKARNVKDASYACNIPIGRGFRYFNDPRVRGGLDRQIEAQSDRMLLTGDRIISELCTIAFFNIKNLYDKKGNLKTPNELSRKDFVAISEIESNTIGKIQTHKYKVIDKMAAIRLLADYKKLVGPGRDEKEKGDIAKKDISDIELVTKVMGILKGGQS